jgi:hypothetical protein
MLTALAMVLVVVTRSVPHAPYDQWQLVWLRMSGDLAFTTVGLIIASRRAANPQAEAAFRLLETIAFPIGAMLAACRWPPSLSASDEREGWSASSSSGSCSPLCWLRCCGSCSSRLGLSDGSHLYWCTSSVRSGLGDPGGDRHRRAALPVV